MYTTDNGAEVMTWPDGGTTPFRGEKATNWEGGFRVPTLIRWLGVIKPNTIYKDMFAHEHFLPTFAAAGGDASVVRRRRPDGHPGQPVEGLLPGAAWPGQRPQKLTPKN